MRAYAWSWLLAIAACTDLGDVDRDRCGNGVIEPSRGEDCDRGELDDPTCGAPGTPVECRLMCGAQIAGEPTCPAGAVCGTDNVCHAPDNTFAVTADTRWTARSLLVGDTTGDGFPELVGVSDEEIVALLGSPDGTYAATFAVPNLPVYDEPRMSDINGDGSQDLTIPVGFGLYSLAGSGSLVLEPLLQNSFAVPGNGRMVTASIDHFILDSSGTVPGPIPNAETMAALHLPMGPNCPQAQGCDFVILGDTGAVLPAGKTIDQIVGDTIPWAWTPGATNQRFVAAIAFPDDLETQPDEGGVYLYRGNLTTTPPTLTPIGAATVSGNVVGRAWFADVDGDGMSDLLASTLIFGNESVSVSYGRADGAFESPSIMLGGPGPQRLGNDALFWGDLNGDNRADFVSASGYIQINECVGRVGNCFGPSLTTERSWVDARIIDVDGDGRKDVVAHAQGAIVVDVLRNTGLPAIWNEAPLTMPGSIKELRVGDFDGNGAGDVAVVTTTPGLAASDGLYISYGRRGDGLAPVTYTGYVGTHVAIQPTTSLIPGRFDSITDLLVVSERAGSRGAALVLGSTSQRMIGPLIPIGDEAGVQFSVVEGVVSLPLNGDDTEDVICLISQIYNDGREAGAVARVFTSSANGALTEVTPASGVTIETTNFLLRGARWVTVPANDGQPAYVIGSDVIGRVAAIPITCTGGTCAAGALQDLTAGGHAGDTLDLEAVDLDSDGDLDLVGAFRPLDGDPMSVPAHVRVWTNSGGYSTATQVAAPPGHAISSIAAIDLDLDGRRELFALVRGMNPGLYRALPQDAGGFGALESAAQMTADDVELGGGITLVGGDVTSDGLPDLIGVFGPEASPQNIKVLVQRERLGVLAGHEDSP